MALGSTQLLTDMSTRNISWGIKAAGVKALTSFADFLEILRASNSWSPKGLSRPVMGWLYLPLGLWSRSRKEFLGGVGVGKNVPTPTPTSV
jgi:hypothetical protein